MQKKHYTESDIQFIKNNYLTLSDEQLAESLKRTLKSVQSKRQRLGLFHFECEKVNTIKGEVWEDVVGFEGKYWISNKGRVKSNKGLLKTYLNEKGYVHFYASTGKTTSKTYRVQRAVALAFIDNPKNKPEVNHKDFNKLNNEVTNLEWVTREENMAHWAEQFK